MGIGGIEEVRMHLEHRCRVDREWAIDVHGNRRAGVLARQDVQLVDDLLGPPHGERRDQNPTASRRGRLDHFGKPGSRARNGLMIPISVCGLHDDGMSPARRDRITNDRESDSSNVS